MEFQFFQMKLCGEDVSTPNKLSFGTLIGDIILFGKSMKRQAINEIKVMH
jgi:hypothetical protein